MDREGKNENVTKVFCVMKTSLKGPARGVKREIKRVVFSEKEAEDYINECRSRYNHNLSDEYEIFESNLVSN